MHTYYPIYRPESADVLVDVALIPPTPIVIGDQTYLTAPLRFDQTISLVGIGRAEDLIISGERDITDTIDRNVRLKAIYIKIQKGDHRAIVRYFPKKNCRNTRPCYRFV